MFKNKNIIRHNIIFNNTKSTHQDLGLKKNSLASRKFYFSKLLNKIAYIHITTIK